MDNLLWYGGGGGHPDVRNALRRWAMQFAQNLVRHPYFYNCFELLNISIIVLKTSGTKNVYWHIETMGLGWGRVET